MVICNIKTVSIIQVHYSAPWYNKLEGHRTKKCLVIIDELHNGI